MVGISGVFPSSSVDSGEEGCGLRYSITPTSGDGFGVVFSSGGVRLLKVKVAGISGPVCVLPLPLLFGIVFAVTSDPMAVVVDALFQSWDLW